MEYKGVFNLSFCVELKIFEVFPTRNGMWIIFMELAMIYDAKLMSLISQHFIIFEKHPKLGILITQKATLVIRESNWNWIKVNSQEERTKILIFFKTIYFTITTIHFCTPFCFTMLQKIYIYHTVSAVG